MDKLTWDGKSECKNLLKVKVNDATYGELSRFGDRITSLLQSQQAEPNRDIVASLDDLLGALYAIIFAKHFGFEDRPNRPIEVSAIVKRAQQVARGEVRTDGKWMAGFHFNSALFRISAVYHRVLKIVAGRDGDVGTLRPQAEEFYRRCRDAVWQNQNVRGIHGQATDLKHTTKGIYESRRIDAGLRNAVLAVGELLDLLEVFGPGTATPT